MATYHTYDVDSVPAPSYVELEAADRAKARARETTLLKALITACQRFGAAHGQCQETAGCAEAIVDPQDWAEFEQAVLAVIGGRLPSPDWKRDAIIAAQDARDLQETQNVACDRHDDGHGIRYDPHLDAY